MIQLSTYHDGYGKEGENPQSKRWKETLREA